MEAAHDAAQVAEVIGIVVEWCIQIGLLYHRNDVASVFHLDVEQILLLQIPFFAGIRKD